MLGRQGPLCKKDCDHLVVNVHQHIAQRAPLMHLASVRRRYAASDLYKVPEALVGELIALVLQPALPA